MQRPYTVRVCVCVCHFEFSDSIAIDYTLMIGMIAILNDIIIHS